MIPYSPLEPLKPRKLGGGKGKFSPPVYWTGVESIEGVRFMGEPPWKDQAKSTHCLGGKKDWEWFREEIAFQQRLGLEGYGENSFQAKRKWWTKTQAGQWNIGRKSCMNSTVLAAPWLCGQCWARLCQNRKLGQDSHLPPHTTLQVQQYLGGLPFL